MNLPRTRRLTIIAQDPEVKNESGKILRTQIEIPAEEFEEGPCGYRVHVVDYDSSTNTLFVPKSYKEPTEGVYPDPFVEYDDDELLADPNFHSQNVYAITMSILAKFEFALGRRVNWNFSGHQLKVAPHAFADTNAFYSRDDQALLFGYFRTRLRKSSKSQEYSTKTVFSCLSHDVVAHETTHAILDGLRGRFTAPSSPEQAGFHEGFADVVALLSVFSLREVVEVLLAKSDAKKQKKDPNIISIESLEREVLKDSALFGLAEEMGMEMSSVRGDALRRSVGIKELDIENDHKTYLDFEEFPEYEQPHRCGELLVAAVMNAFLEVWLKRIERLKHRSSELKFLDLYLIAEQGKDAADHLLTMAIRALDYTPPTDLKFGDFLSALLTSDSEAVPDDSRYGYREILVNSFAKFGIKPTSKDKNGKWQKPVNRNEFVYDRTHFESLLQDENEVFRFIWDNRKALGLDEDAYTQVQSVRPCLRVAPDGFVMRETVAEYVQISTLRSQELHSLGTPIQNTLPDNIRVTLYGGGTLIFDEYGRLKYHIYNRLYSQAKQSERLKYLWKYGYLIDEKNYNKDLFLTMHLNRTASVTNTFLEEF